MRKLLTAEEIPAELERLRKVTGLADPFIYEARDFKSGQTVLLTGTTGVVLARLKQPAEDGEA